MRIKKDEEHFQAEMMNKNINGIELKFNCEQNNGLGNMLEISYLWDDGLKGEFYLHLDEVRTLDKILHEFLKWKRDLNK